MREGWIETTLPHVVEVLDRLRRPISAIERDRRIGAVRYFGANGQAGWIDEFIFNETLVLLGEDAIDFLNPKASKAYMVTGPSWVNNHAHVLRADTSKVLPYFLTELLNAVDYSQYVSFGTRSKLTQGSMNGIKLQIPPLQEQKRIVDLISSVDSYINALQQQAGTARKSRNAVLHELLSAGGDVWVETTLGEVADWGSGGTPKADNAAYYYGEIPWCVIGDLTESDVWETEKKITQAGLEKSSAKIIQPGSVLLAMYGASIGRTGISAVLMATNQAIAFASVHESRLINRFLLIYLQTQKSRFIESGQGAAQPNISQTIIKSWPITLPPVITQNEIVDLVTTVENVCIGIEQALAKARYLRSALLADLLSGDHEIPASYDKIMGVA